MSKQKTLLSFFKKVPSSESDTNESQSPRSEAKPSSKAPPKAHEAQASPKTKATTDASDKLSEVYQLVWAKLDGYPWWPALVCQDPDNRRHVSKKQIHVQFFDKPPSRSWVNRETAIVLYNGQADSDKRNPSKCSSSDRAKLQVAVEEADQALKIPQSQRDVLLVDFDSAAEEEGSENDDKENDDPPSEKKAKLDFDSEDSEDEFKPDKEMSDDGDDEMTSPEPSESEEQSSVLEPDEEDGCDKSKKRKKKVTHKTGSKRPKTDSATPMQTPKARTSLFQADSPSSPATPRNLSTSLMQKMAAFKSPAAPAKSKPPAGQSEGNWPHLKLAFLQPEKIMDKMKRRPDHPEYDGSTLFVPEDFKNNCTPGMRQWWELKSNNWDTVLFFKVGKFYELYHMDAVIGVDELSLSLMRGEFAHSGFPEIAYGRFATILVQKGFKVARVEQMETPDMMAERCKGKKTTKFDKVVQREVCQVTSKGTVSHSVMDGEARDPNANYLMALTEKDGSYGVCFIDVSIGVFHVGQFQDDKYLSRMRTLLSHCAPAEVIYERRDMSEKSLLLLNSMLSGVAKRPLHSDTEFWTASKTLNVLANREELRGTDGNVEWPAVLRQFISPNDPLGLTPSDNGRLALSALGACIWYLQRSFLDTQVLAMKQFHLYDPVDGNINLKGQYLILDDITLTNLEVLRNSRGGVDGTLLSRLDRCCTFFGKRMLRQWLCAALADPVAIRDRQKAIEELIEKADVTQELRKLLKSTPDLERLLAKIHSQGNAITAKNHPDSRAIFFEEKTYSKRKIQDFLTALAGFRKVNETIAFLKKDPPNSKDLVTCSQCPDLSPHLDYFDNAFDHMRARGEGTIVPKSAGIDADYDSATEELQLLEKERQQYLKEQCAYFGVQVKYFGTDKNRYQLEVAEGAARKANSRYEFTSSRKGFKRFMTEETKDFLKRQMQAEDAQRVALRDLRRRIFENFGNHYADWSQAVACVAKLDVLMALAEYARCESETCIPEFAEPSARPFINIESGRHPCIPVADGFIPNSTELGTDNWRSLVLLTGPNMGGKSTLLRQLGLHVIMAHIGCRLPAASATLTPVDRVFTRIGAGDDILAGESTFYQELSETGLIIQHATERSVVLVDELGRGTSTYDGTAIAHAVLVELAQRGCLTLFSTHYHSLVEELQTSNDRISLGHMACATEGDSITFLYQFSQGACPSSHGFHAARLAGLPEPIIKAGQAKAEQLVKETNLRQLFRKLCISEVASETIDSLASAISALL